MDWRIRDGRRKTFNTSGHAHELTFSCYRRHPFLQAERTCLWLAEAINQARLKYDFALWAYVFMPDHAHIILFPREAQYDIGKIAGAIKLPVARRAVQFLQANKSPWLEKLTRQRDTRTERLFWQSGGGYDRNITSGKTLLQMIDYVHLNPVRRGLVERAMDWRWSSAAAFESGISPISVDAIPWEWLADT